MTFTAQLGPGFHRLEHRLCPVLAHDREVSGALVIVPNIDLKRTHKVKDTLQSLFSTINKEMP